MCKIPVLRETLRETEACTQNVPFELEEALVEREDVFFYGFILTSCRVSGENRESLWSVTAATTYHWLSQMGVKILSAFGSMQQVSKVASLERARKKSLSLKQEKGVNDEEVEFEEVK